MATRIEFHNRDQISHIRIVELHGRFIHQSTDTGICSRIKTRYSDEYYSIDLRLDYDTIEV